MSNVFDVSRIERNACEPEIRELRDRFCQLKKGFTRLDTNPVQPGIKLCQNANFEIQFGGGLPQSGDGFNAVQRDGQLYFSREFGNRSSLARPITGYAISKSGEPA